MIVKIYAKNQWRCGIVGGLSLSALTLFAANTAAAPPVVIMSPNQAAAETAARCDSTSGDGAATSAIESRMLWSSLIESDDVRVLTIDGLVELRGLVRSEAQKVQIGRVARDTYGVVGVSNEIDVVDWMPITETARAQAQTRTIARLAAHGKSDAWITSTVKSTLGLSRGTGNCAIGVTTRSGVVSLSGQVGSGVARDVAVELARNTLGVRQVDADALGVR